MQHVASCSMMGFRLGIKEESVTHREREKTKRVVYSLIYGMGNQSNCKNFFIIICIIIL